MDQQVYFLVASLNIKINISISFIIYILNAYVGEKKLSSKQNAFESLR